jgi:hypothetical protein
MASVEGLDHFEFEEATQSSGDPIGATVSPARISGGALILRSAAVGGRQGRERAIAKAGPRLTARSCVAGASPRAANNRDA